VIKDIFYYGKNLKNKLHLVCAFFMPPEWIIQQLKKENALFAKQQASKKNSDSPKLYMLLNLALIIVLYVYVSFTFSYYSLNSWVIETLILFTIYGLGRVANGNLNLRMVEIMRTILVITSLELLADNPILALSTGLLFFVGNYFLFYIGSSPLPAASNRATFTTF
jgi:hypothetical protein